MNKSIILATAKNTAALGAAQTESVFIIGCILFQLFLWAEILHGDDAPVMLHPLCVTEGHPFSYGDVTSASGLKLIMDGLFDSAGSSTSQLNKKTTSDQD